MCCAQSMAECNSLPGRLDPALVADARALIGVPWRRCQYNHLVSRPAINRCAKSIGFERSNL